MSKLPIGILDTTRITQSLISLSDQTIADNENRKLSNQLRLIYGSVNRFNELAASSAKIISMHCGELTSSIGVDITSANPITQCMSFQTTPLSLKSYDVAKLKNTTRFNQNAVNSPYHWHLYNRHIPMGKIESSSMSARREAYLKALSWCTAVYIKQVDVDYVPSAIDFAMSEFNDVTQADFTSRLEKRVRIICEQSLQSSADWVHSVLKFHSRYETSKSVLPTLDSIPQMSIIGYFAQQYEFDITKAEKISPQESKLLTNIHHPMLQKKCPVPSDWIEMLNNLEQSSDSDLTNSF
jgi:hypothetical protein